MVKVTKEKLRNLVNEYVDDADKPEEHQLECRYSLCFDKNSIVDEIHAIINDGHSRFDPKRLSKLRILLDDSGIEELRRCVRVIMRVAEQHANMFKRARVIDEDITYGFILMDSMISFSYLDTRKKKLKKTRQ
jgi:hypothetical protein